jgi:hypothetical protein
VGVKKALIIAAFVGFGCPFAYADSDTLQPITFASIQGDLKKSLSKMSVQETVVPVGCLDGEKDKRTVCTFKIGKFLSVMASSKKGEKDVVAITMICNTESPSDAIKCLLGYAALMTATAPNMSKETRGKIINTLTGGLEVGTETTILTEERKYMLQKSVGLWFHVMAADGEGE